MRLVEVEAYAVRSNTWRTLADMPGEELGGSRRQYRDVWAPDGPDAITHTLEWWHEGRWQPYARGTYRLVRAGSGGR